MNSVKAASYDRVFSDFGRFVRSTPFKVLAGAALLVIALLMGASHGQSGAPLAAKYSVADTTE